MDLPFRSLGGGWSGPVPIGQSSTEPISPPKEGKPVAGCPLFQFPPVTPAVDDATPHHKAIAPVSALSYLLSPTQAAASMTHLYQVLLPHLGVNYHFLVILCHALPGHHGLGLPNPYWEQSISGLCLFLEQANATSFKATLIQTSVGTWDTLKFILTSICYLKLLATDCWLKTIWQFVNFAQLQLMPLTPVIPPPPWQYDGAIMEDVLSSPLPKSSILAINCCHIAHQAIYWSDVVNGWGNGIAPAMLCPPSTPQSSWSWPLEKPSLSDWSIWAAFMKDTPHTSGGCLILLLPYFP